MMMVVGGDGGSWWDATSDNNVERGGIGKAILGTLALLQCLLLVLLQFLLLLLLLLLPTNSPIKFMISTIAVTVIVFPTSGSNTYNTVKTVK